MSDVDINGVILESILIDRPVGDGDEYGAAEIGRIRDPDDQLYVDA